MITNEKQKHQSIIDYYVIVYTILQSIYLYFVLSSKNCFLLDMTIVSLKKQSAPTNSISSSNKYSTIEKYQQNLLNILNYSF